VSSTDLPAYLFRSGLMSKDSTCETPPQRKIQMTDLARGAKCGAPVGGRQGSPAASWGRLSPPRALATPSRKSIAASAKPVKPMPVSTRNERRETPGQLGCFRVIDGPCEISDVPISEALRSRCG